MKKNKKNLSITGVLVAGAIVTSATLTTIPNGSIEPDTNIVSKEQSIDNIETNANASIGSKINTTVTTLPTGGLKNSVIDVGFTASPGTGAGAPTKIFLKIFRSDSGLNPLQTIEAPITATTATFTNAVGVGNFYVKAELFRDDDYTWYPIANSYSSRFDIKANPMMEGSYPKTTSASFGKSDGKIAYDYGLNIGSSVVGTAKVELITSRNEVLKTTDITLTSSKVQHITGEFDVLPIGAYSMRFTMEADSTNSLDGITWTDSRLIVSEEKGLDAEIKTLEAVGVKSPMHSGNGSINVNWDIALNDSTKTTATLVAASTDANFIIELNTTAITNGVGQDVMENLPAGSYDVTLTIEADQATSLVSKTTSVIIERTLPPSTITGMEITNNVPATFGTKDGEITLASTITENDDEDKVQYVLYDTNGVSVQFKDKVDIVDGVATHTFTKLPAGSYVATAIVLDYIEDIPDPTPPETIGTFGLPTMDLEFEILVKEGTKPIVKPEPGTPVKEEDGSVTHSNIKVVVSSGTPFINPMFKIYDSKGEVVSSVAGKLEDTRAIGTYVPVETIVIPTQNVTDGYSIDFEATFEDGSVEKLSNVITTEPVVEVEESNKLSPGAIAGIIIGSLGGSLIILGSILKFNKSKKTKQEEPKTKKEEPKDKKNK